MKTSRFISGILFSLLMVLNLSCKHQEFKKENQLVQSYPHGAVFKANMPIRITFTKTPDLASDLGKSTHQQLIETRPHVDGKIFRTSDKALTFVPETPLEYGKTYEVLVHLDKLYKHPANKTFSFNIKVNPLYFDLHFSHLKPGQAGQPQQSQLTGNIIASDRVNLEKLQKNIFVRIDNTALNMKLQPGNDPTTFNFIVDSILRAKKQTNLKISILGKPFGLVKNLEWIYVIPPANQFTMLQYNVVKKPETHLELTFSDFLSTDQNLDGLIYFQDGSKIRLSVKDNVVKVYPVYPLKGEHKLIVSKKIQNRKGKNLSDDYEIKAAFAMVPPQLRFLGKGNILAGKAKWIIPFEAINLAAVDVVIFKIYSNNVHQFLQQYALSEAGWSLDRVGEYIHHEKITLRTGSREPDNKWKSYAIDLTKMIDAEPGAIYKVSFRFKKADALYSCADDTSQQIQDLSDSTNYYYSNYYYPKNYRWTERNDPCKNSYYYQDRFVERNFQATNIGLTVKGMGDMKYKVYARDLLTAGPLSKIRVQFYSYQNQLLAETTTDGQGEAEIQLKKSPFLVIAKDGKQYAYLRLKGGTALSYSKFKTDGVRTKTGLKGTIFGERGVWRPGDTLFLTFVLQDKAKVLPAGHPLQMEVRDARDRKIYSENTTRGINGFYVFKVPTSQDAPTGLWRAKVQIGNETFTKNLRVETILPNRIKMEMRSPFKRYTYGKNRTIQLEAKWLHDGLAAGLKAQVTENIAPIQTVFTNFKAYQFDDPSKQFYPDEQDVFDGKLDTLGKAKIKVVLPQGKRLPGMLQLTFVSKVFEPGGRFSIDQKSFEYAPYSRFVGIKAPDASSQGYLETNKNQSFAIVTLDANGKKVPVDKLKVEVFKLDWSWWYNSNNSNLGSYISRHYNDRILSKTIRTQHGKANFSFKVNYPEWGNYFIRVTDVKGGHSTGMTVYFDWPSSYSRSNRRSPGDATLLSLSADKEKYAPGETVHLRFPTPKNAKVLISIEKNSQLLKSWWVDAADKETEVQFKITKAMTPNVYAFVSVIQPHLQTKNDLPIRSYGLIPIAVEDPENRLHPVLEAPEKIKPEAGYTLKVSEASHRQMTYVLAIVDEGLLDLTHFKTPSLYDYFYKKEALAVKTWDYYNDVNGAYGGRLSQVFAIGGDEALTKLGRKKVNRFKPVVSFLGPFTLDAGSKGKVHHLKMANYMGAVRVMVVAGNSGAYGKTSKTIPVKQGLMVLASLPRTLVPGETLRLPVSIFATENNIKKVNLSVKTNAFFRTNQPEQSITFSKAGEKTAFVDLKVADREGIGTAQLEVRSGKERASYEVQINIRNPNQRVYETQTFVLAKGKSWSGMPSYQTTQTGHKLSITVSKIPSVKLQKRLQYLIHYPYGCVEQTVSAAFPQLYLERFIRLNDEKKLEVEKNISKAISRLAYFQRSSGGFSYWPGQNSVDRWASSYAGQFLLLAKDAGYYIPIEMLNKWTAYQQRQSNLWQAKKRDYAFDQAYRLYTLALAGQPNLSAMNRLREMKNMDSQTRLRLAAAYALINEKSTAKKLLEDTHWQIPADETMWRYSYGSQTRDDAMALETYVLLNDKATAFEIFKTIAKTLGSGQWLSTQTTAYSLYALAQFIGDEKQQDHFRFSYAFAGKKKVINSEKPVFIQELKVFDGKKLKVNNLSGQQLFLNVETSGIPLPGQTVNQQKGLALSVKYFDMKGKAIDETNLSQGKDFYARIVVSNPSLRDYQNLALSAIFPSGWEILNTRMLNIGQNLKSSSSDYLDIRDDRVNLFFGLHRKRSKTFYVLLNAAYPGEYFRAPVSCKAMYYNTIDAALGGGKVKVKR
jgi:uncharacterized protein YfaS (alpha-2-macroglobulin family)